MTEAGWLIFKMSSCPATCIIYKELPLPGRMYLVLKATSYYRLQCPAFGFLSCLPSLTLLLDPDLHDLQASCLPPVVSVWALWLISQMLLIAFNFALVTILSLPSDKGKSLIRYNVAISSFFEGGGQGGPGWTANWSP